MSPHTFYLHSVSTLPTGQQAFPVTVTTSVSPDMGLTHAVFYTSEALEAFKLGCTQDGVRYVNKQTGPKAPAPAAPPPFPSAIKAPEAPGDFRLVYDHMANCEWSFLPNSGDEDKRHVPVFTADSVWGVMLVVQALSEQELSVWDVDSKRRLSGPFTGTGCGAAAPAWDAR